MTTHSAAQYEQLARSAIDCITLARGKIFRAMNILRDPNLARAATLPTIAHDIDAALEELVGIDNQMRGLEARDPRTIHPPPEPAPRHSAN